MVLIIYFFILFTLSIIGGEIKYRYEKRNKYSTLECLWKVEANKKL